MAEKSAISDPSDSGRRRRLPLLYICIYCLRYAGAHTERTARTFMRLRDNSHAPSAKKFRAPIDFLPPFVLY